MSFGAGFRATIHLACETGYALFANCMDVEGALSKEVEASRNHLVVVDLHNYHNWYSALYGWAAEDLVVIDEVAFMAT